MITEFKPWKSSELRKQRNHSSRIRRKFMPANSYRTRNYPENRGKLTIKTKEETPIRETEPETHAITSIRYNTGEKRVEHLFDLGYVGDTIKDNAAKGSSFKEKYKKEITQVEKGHEELMHKDKTLDVLISEISVDKEGELTIKRLNPILSGTIADRAAIQSKPTFGEIAHSYENNSKRLPPYLFEAIIRYHEEAMDGKGFKLMDGEELQLKTTLTTTKEADN